MITNRKILQYGQIGEQTVQYLLERLNPKKYIVLNDLMFRHGNGRTTQIDHVLVSRKGIFVIETKNYSGVLYGDCDSRYWTHVSGKNKMRLYSCVKQNEGHIKSIKNLLIDVLDYLSDRKYYKFFVSIIVVNDNCKLKISGKQKKLRIINFNKLVKTIRRINRRNLISESVKEDIVTILEENNIQCKINNKEHLRQIKAMKY